MGSLALLFVLGGVLVWLPAQQSPAGRRPLVLYCAAGLKAPVEEIARRFEQQFGVPVQLQYGGSQTLLANLEVAQRGDLYLPADDSYLALARDKKRVTETVPLVQMRPVLAVLKGNPRQIHSLDDLLRGGIRLAQANPDAAAIGKVVRSALIPAGYWERIEARTLVFKPTVNDVAADVKVGAVDAAFVWDALVRQIPGLEAVELPELAGVTAKVSVGVLASSHTPAEALKFARYLSASDLGLPVFVKHGYEPVE